MARVYKVELMVIDELSGYVGAEEIKYLLEHAEDVYSKVMSMQFADIDDWDDDHPINNRDTADEYYKNLVFE